MRIIAHSDTRPTEPELADGECLLSAQLTKRVTRFFHVDLEGLTEQQALTSLRAGLPTARSCQLGWPEVQSSVPGTLGVVVPAAHLRTTGDDEEE